MPCPHTHTSWQPEQLDLICPNCGSNSYYFSIDFSPTELGSECELIHTEDVFLCSNCDSLITGAELAKNHFKLKTPNAKIRRMRKVIRSLHRALWSYWEMDKCAFHSSEANDTNDKEGKCSCQAHVAFRALEEANAFLKKADVL